MGNKGMNDLISRSALLEEIKLQKWYAGEIQNQSYRTAFIASLSMLEGKIAEIPAADAETVRHGRWKYLPPNINSVGAYSCSACGFLVFDHRANKCNYCPNCGARMEAEVKDHGSDSTEHAH